MADKKTDDFIKRRKELASVSSLKGFGSLKGLGSKYEKTLGSFPVVKTKNSPLKTLGDTDSYLARRTRLAGLTSVNFSSALKDMPKPKPTTLSKVASSILKKSPVRRVIDAGTKIGLGAAAGYEYAKSKFKKDDKSKDVKVDKKATGGMADYIKELL